MSDIKWVIEPADIEWPMEWGDDPAKFRGKVGTEMMFEREHALAQLLINEVVFLSAYWWKYEKLGKSNPDGGISMEPREDATWTKEESRLISVSVNCNDVFAWACSDAESLPHDEIENLYRMWLKDPSWGAAVWCMIQRRQMPQRPVEKIIQKAGIWDLASLKLGENTQDAECQALFASLRQGESHAN